MVNFIVVSSEGYLSKEPDFIRLYNKGVLVPEIRRKLSLSTPAYNKLYRKCVDEGSITPRIRKRTKKKEIPKKRPKNYYKNNNSFTFRVIKNNVYYANMRSAKEAELFVELMEEIGWDKSKVEEVKEQCRIILKEN